MVVKGRLLNFLKLLSVLAGLFFLGFYSGAIVIKPVLHIVLVSMIFGLVPFLFLVFLPALGIYMAVNMFIVYYYNDITYHVRLSLLASGLIVFYAGIFSAL